MKAEQLIKREDGSKIRIEANLTIQDKINWRVEVWKCEPNKRKFYNVVNTDDYQYRKQSFPDGRTLWANKKQLEFVTPQEIIDVKNMVLQSIIQSLTN